jgi:20S proteasome alpha/beta subunit
VYRKDDSPAYDREITTFNDDGRLSQVEYGIEASLRGSTVGAIKTRDAIVVCIENSSFGKMHRVDDHLWMLTAGLSGDARMLAHQVRIQCQNHRLTYGEPPTVEDAARMAAEFQHKLTRVGGCRPLGCSSVLLGVCVYEDGKGSRLKMFQTDPGGGLEECDACASGKEGTNFGKDLQALLDHLLEAETKKPRVPVSMTNVASKIADALFRRMDPFTSDKKRPQMLDVWTIQTMDGHRGEMLATCYRNVEKGRIKKLVEEMDEWTTPVI